MYFHTLGAVCLRNLSDYHGEVVLTAAAQHPVVQPRSFCFKVNLPAELEGDDCIGDRTMPSATARKIVSVASPLLKKRSSLAVLTTPWLLSPYTCMVGYRLIL